MALPDFTTQDPTTYKANIDVAFAGFRAELGSSASSISIGSLLFDSDSTEFYPSVAFEARLIGVTGSPVPILELNSDATVTNYRRTISENAAAVVSANDNDIMIGSFAAGDFIAINGIIHQNSTSGVMTVDLTVVEVQTGVGVNMHKSVISYETSGVLSSLSLAVSGGSSFFAEGCTLHVNQV